MITKKQCVACNNKLFAGKSLEVLDHLCKKHRKEYIIKQSEQVKTWLESRKK